MGWVEAGGYAGAVALGFVLGAIIVWVRMRATTRDFDKFVKASEAAYASLKRRYDAILSDNNSLRNKVHGLKKQVEKASDKS